MPILPDSAIAAVMSHRIRPWEISNINPASLDLRLGNVWLDISNGKYVKYTQDNITLYPQNLQTTLHNMVFKHAKWPTLVLATTMETIDLPANVCAMVKLKTTPCREGLGHPIADWVDPGFCGQLTLMLHAFKPITLRYGQRVCQIVFDMMDQACDIPYGRTGHYMGQSGPTPSWREYK